MDDTISRQAAIDAIERAKTVCSQYGEIYVAKLNAEMNIQILPSAEPEIIHCRDCKHHSHDADYGRDWCNRMSGVFRVKPDDYCSFAERKTDE